MWLVICCQVFKFLLQSRPNHEWLIHGWCSLVGEDAKTRGREREGAGWLEKMDFSWGKCSRVYRQWCVLACFPSTDKMSCQTQMPELHIFNGSVDMQRWEGLVCGGWRDRYCVFMPFLYRLFWLSIKTRWWIVWSSSFSRVHESGLAKILWWKHTFLWNARTFEACVC